MPERLGRWLVPLCWAIAAAWACLVWPGPAAGADAPAAVFYVAPGGNDAWSGTRSEATADDGPFATLEAARDAARKAEAGRPRRIVVAGGRYFLKATLVLDGRDSGLAVEPAAGARPVLVGGRRIEGWRKDGDRFWAAAVPEAKGRAWDFRMLVVNGRFCPRARVPGDGHFTHLSRFDVPWMSTTGGGWKRKPTTEELTTMAYRPEDLEPWLDPANAEVTVYHMWDESVAGVAKIDTQAHTLTFTNPLGHPPGAFGVTKYVVWNVREGMTAPGQWYLDRSAGKVVYWPLEGEDVAAADVLAPTLECLIRLAGRKEAPVADVTIRGLALTVTNTPLRTGGFGAFHFDGALVMRETRGGLLQDLVITNVNGHGVRTDAAAGVRVEGCEVHHTGACGLLVRGDGAVVADNLVHHVGLAYPSGIGIAGGGKGNRIVHNAVHDTTYTAINYSGEDVCIEANRLWRAMLVLHDGGGIYCFAPRRLVMRGNFIHDIPDTGGYGSSAYYLDERAEDCVVEGNLSLRVARPSHNHMAKNNTVRGNVFVCDGDAAVTFPRSSGYTFEKNVVVAEGKITFSNPDGMTACRDNVLFSKAGKVEGQKLRDYSAAGTEPLGPGGANVLADPRLVDGWEKGVVRFAPDSPALKLGIAPIDVSGAGPRKP